MDLVTLNEIIRKEPVCLWIGAGFSLYAGMPSVTEIKDILYQSLSDEEKKLLDFSTDLKRFTQDFELLKGREKLAHIVRERFRKPVISTHVHDLLARISYFRSIITTNYDQLIENAFSRQAAVIMSDADVFTGRMARTRIYKIHGDIDKPDSIVLTANDYSKMYNRTFKDPFWSAVNHEISSNDIIFLGYGYEDENVWADFDYINERIGNSAKRRFFISPSISPVKALHLKRLGIEYLEATGEQFLMQLIEDIKENLCEDIANGFVDTQIAQDFITGFDLRARFEATSDSTELVSVERVNGLTEHKLSVVLSDPEAIETYQKFVTGYEIRQLHLSSDQMQRFAIYTEGFNVLDKRKLVHINLEHEPRHKGICNIKFDSHDFVLNNVRYAIYNDIPGKMMISLKAGGYELIANIDMANNQVSSTYEVKEPLKPVSLIKSFCFFKAVFLFFSGEEAGIYQGETQLFKQRIGVQDEAAELKKCMVLYSSLLKIERAFDIRFKAISVKMVTKDIQKIIRKLVCLIDQGYYAVKVNTGLTINNMPAETRVFAELASKRADGTYSFFVTKSPHSISLFGLQLRLGSEQVILKEPKLTVNDFDNLKVTIVPSDNIIVYRYKKFGHQEVSNSEILWEE